MKLLILLALLGSCKSHRFLRDTLNITFSLPDEDAEELMGALEDRFLNETIKVNEEMERHNRSSRQALITWSWLQHHDYLTVKEKLRKYARKYDKLVTIESLGKTFEKNDIVVLRINDKDYCVCEKPKRSIYIVANFYGCAWSSTMHAMFVIESLLTAERDSQLYIKSRRYKWHIIPIANPDGYEYSFNNADNNKRVWIKNRNTKVCPPLTFPGKKRCRRRRSDEAPVNSTNLTHSNPGNLIRRKRHNCEKSNTDDQKHCTGVNIFHNWPYMWDSQNSNAFTRYYPGPHALSEQETQLIKKYIHDQNGISPMRAFFDFRESRGSKQRLLLPYGIPDKKLDDLLEQKSFLKTAASAFKCYTVVIQTLFEFCIEVQHDYCLDAGGGKGFTGNPLDYIKSEFLTPLVVDFSAPSIHKKGNAITGTQIHLMCKEHGKAVELLLIEYDKQRPIHVDPACQADCDNKNKNTPVDCPIECLWVMMMMGNPCMMGMMIPCSPYMFGRR